MSTAAILIWDIGTSHVKCTAFNQQLTAFALEQHDLQTSFGDNGEVEQIPDHWWMAMQSTAQQLLKQYDLQITAVGITGQMAGVVAVDGYFKAIRPALIWMDTRSEKIAKRVMSGFPKVSGYGVFKLINWIRLTNGAPSLAGKDPTSKMLWLKQKEPDNYHNAAYLLDVKDYLISRISNKALTTPDCAHLSWMMESRNDARQWHLGLIEKLGLDRRKLPQIVDNREIIGEIEAHDELLGVDYAVPVIAGAGDITAASIGCGASRLGVPHIYIGTSAWIAVHQGKPKVDPLHAIGSVCSAFKGRHLYIATQETAGVCLNWLAKNMNLTQNDQPDFGRINQLATQAEPGCDGLMFFPWLKGERVPIDNPDIRGGFTGLTLQHGQSEMLRAVMEGVAFNLKWARDTMSKSARLPDDEALIFCGGGAKSDLWCQIFADVLNQPIKRPLNPVSSVSRGVALLAAKSIGWIDDIDIAAGKKEYQHFYPMAKNVQTYGKGYKRFRHMFQICFKKSGG